MNDIEVRPYAAHLAEVHPEEGEVAQRLVVVWATSRQDAMRETGLLEADFHEASPPELREWAVETLRDLTREDLRQLISYVRKQSVGIGNRRRRSKRAMVDRRLRYKARKLAQLRGKLELLLEAAEGDMEPDFDDDAEPVAGDDRPGAFLDNTKKEVA